MSKIVAEDWAFGLRLGIISASQRWWIQQNDHAATHSSSHKYRNANTKSLGSRPQRTKTGWPAWHLGFWGFDPDHAGRAWLSAINDLREDFKLQEVVVLFQSERLERALKPGAVNACWWSVVHKSLMHGTLRGHFYSVISFKGQKTETEKRLIVWLFMG